MENAQISPYLATLLRRAGLTPSEMGADVARARLPDGSAAWLPPDQVGDVAEAQRHLRLCFAYGMAHIVWWEQVLHGDVEASWRAISHLADGLLQGAYAMATRLLAPRFGTLAEGEYCLIGLGKLGGRELNLGSDVDLLAVWRGEGETRGGRRSVAAEAYVAHLTRMVIRLIDEQTEDGGVWPVDMRLRPGGAAAPITLSLDATLDHYLNYGQTWERAMLSKARPVAGSKPLGEALIAGLDPFIYMRHLDYTTVHALAEMKRRIDAQSSVQEIGAGFDVKRGRGGIREIEFMIQSRLLLYGGRHREIRRTGSMEALAAMAEAELIGADDARMLRESYRFWRRIEHALQARRGEQTQILPADYADWLPAATGIDAVRDAMRDHAQRVHRAFVRHLMPIATEQDGAVGWLDQPHLSLPDSLDAEQRRRITAALATIRNHLLRGILPERCHGHLARILARAMPAWLDDANGVTALEAFADLIINISGRATWIDLLATHEGALQWLIGVLAASSYIARQIARNPAWLEWPLEQEQHGHDIDRICARLAAIDPADTEQALRALGRQVDRGRLLAALAVDAHEADAVTIGRWLARIADGATLAALRIGCAKLGLGDDFPMVALAMGKHGSEEMGLSSDLDMVFVLASDDPTAACGGRTMFEQAQRLGRRVIQILTAAPPFGAGFAVDARLRPSGQSGTLVTTVAGFDDYQRHHADSWEHQALCRARALGRNRAAVDRVAAVVEAVLRLPRDPAALAADVVAMRQKMVDHLASKNREVINLKQDPGGVVDIEFLAQYAKLLFGVRERMTAEIFTHLPPAAPPLWHRYGADLARHHLAFRTIDLLLQVELGRSMRTLPASEAAAEWETLRRHGTITSPKALRAAMKDVRAAFGALLQEA